MVPDNISGAVSSTLPGRCLELTRDRLRGVLQTIRLLTIVVTVVGLQVGCSQGPVKPEVQPEQSAKRPQAPVAPLTAGQQTKLARAGALVQSGELAEAARIMDELIAARPERGDLKARLAWIRQHQDQPEQAITLYQQALAQTPSDAMAINNLALLQQKQGRFQQASEVLRNGLEYAQDNPELHYNLGVLSELYLLDLKAALAQYKRYRDLSGKDDHRVDGWIVDLERRLN